MSLDYERLALLLKEVWIKYNTNFAREEGCSMAGCGIREYRSSKVKEGSDTGHHSFKIGRTERTHIAAGLFLLCVLLSLTSLIYT